MDNAAFFTRYRQVENYQANESVQFLRDVFPQYDSASAMFNLVEFQRALAVLNVPYFDSVKKLCELVNSPEYFDRLKAALISELPSTGIALSFVLEKQLRKDNHYSGPATRSRDYFSIQEVESFIPFPYGNLIRGVAARDVPQRSVNGTVLRRPDLGVPVQNATPLPPSASSISAPSRTLSEATSRPPVPPAKSLPQPNQVKETQPDTNATPRSRVPPFSPELTAGLSNRKPPPPGKSPLPPPLPPQPNISSQSLSALPKKRKPQMAKRTGFPVHAPSGSRTLAESESDAEKVSTLAVPTKLGSKPNGAAVDSEVAEPIDDFPLTFDQPQDNDDESEPSPRAIKRVRKKRDWSNTESEDGRDGKIVGVVSDTEEETFVSARAQKAGRGSGSVEVNKQEDKAIPELDEAEENDEHDTMDVDDDDANSLRSDDPATASIIIPKYPMAPKLSYNLSIHPRLTDTDPQKYELAISFETAEKPIEDMNLTISTVLGSRSEDGSYSLTAVTAYFGCGIPDETGRHSFTSAMARKFPENTISVFEILHVCVAVFCQGGEDALVRGRRDLDFRGFLKKMKKGMGEMDGVCEDLRRMIAGRPRVVDRKGKGKVVDGEERGVVETLCPLCDGVPPEWRSEWERMRLSH